MKYQRKISLGLRYMTGNTYFNSLNAELNPIRHLLALVGARHIVHVSRIGINVLFVTNEYV